MRIWVWLMAFWCGGVLAAESLFEADSERLPVLLEQDASLLEARDQRGDTPLLAAARAADLDRVRWLLSRGADVNAMNSERRDILNLAITVRSPALVRMALDAGADPATVTSVYEGSALIYASHQAQTEIVSMLIAAGAPLDRVNNLGWTALLEASILGDGSEAYAEIVRLLLAAGADKNIADRKGRTPLDNARLRGHQRLVQLLED